MNVACCPGSAVRYIRTERRIAAAEAGSRAYQERSSVIAERRSTPGSDMTTSFSVSSGHHTSKTTEAQDDLEGRHPRQ
eukprot:1108-Rhodomonas_salina.1